MMNQGKDFVICYAQDGKQLADYIQSRFSSARFNCSVEIVDLAMTVKRSQTMKPLPFQTAKVNVLIVSPIFLKRVNFLNVNLEELLPEPETAAVLYFHVKVKGAEQTLLGLCENAFIWTKKDASTEDSLKECLVILMTLLEDDCSTPLPVLSKFTLSPTTITWNVDTVQILFTECVKGCVEIQQDEEDKIKAVLLNPYTYMFHPKGLYSGDSVLEIFIDSKSIGQGKLTYLSKTEELEVILRDVSSAQDFVCQAVMGKSPKSLGALDHTLAHMFATSSQSLPFKCSFLNFDVDNIYDHRETEYPTFLHFAAKHGLKNLCKSIVETPAGKLANRIKNNQGHTPADIALMNQHRSLSEELWKAILAPSTDDAGGDTTGAESEAYCPMERKSDGSIPGQRESKDDQSEHRRSVGRSMSSPDVFGQESNIYMDMNFNQPCQQEFRGRTNLMQAKKQDANTVTRRRRPTARYNGEKMSDRVSLINEEDMGPLPALPPKPFEDRRVYASIKILDTEAQQKKDDKRACRNS